MSPPRLGLYVHIPFCSKICHYCDFAKTSNYSADHVTSYLRALCGQLAAWSQRLPAGQKFTSVFFGGGTPGVLTVEYQDLMASIRDLTVPGAEITLESNPGNVTRERVKVWRELGFNRLSIGVQSFDPDGLRALTRDHDAGDALRALELASELFPRSNGDLIYGWNGQSEESWTRDLETMASAGVNHLSLYALTYEGNTPFARAQRRGAVDGMSGDDLARRYQLACDLLRGAGFQHEEISNWSRPGGGCDHNWLYWRGEYFVGIGAGAHGFVDDGSGFGVRYSYPGDLRQFLRGVSGDASAGVSGDSRFYSAIEAFGGLRDADRDSRSWLLEYVGCSLRARDGVNLRLIEERGFRWVPNARIDRALREGLLSRAGDYLTATESEWFRETAWSFEVCESIQGQGSISISNPSPK